MIAASQARRIALAAQGFAKVPSGASTRRAVLGAVAKTNLLQLDSVSAVVRAHYAPVFARIGAYDRTLLDAAVWSHSARQPRRLVEYWAHEAALVPVEDWPLFRWRMRDFADGRWGGARRVLQRNPTLGADVLEVVARHGACTAAQIEAHLEYERPTPSGPWWDRSDVKVIAEQLFAAGELSIDRRVGFMRYYDLTERVLPPHVRARVVPEEEAVYELVDRAARALGIATEPDLRDYYRLHRRQTEPAIKALVADGVLTEVSVAGWPVPAYLHHTARTPRRIERSALLCPFDPVVFFRSRLERMFNFHYRIEIYTPEPKRVHGYYVFPFLLGDRMVARVDLRADRAARVLSVPGAFAEAGADPSAVAAALAGALRELANWLDVDDIIVGERGDLAPDLRLSVAKL